ncbi:MAG: pyridoxamine 5'-phosphate oxidase family protein [Bacteroidales bacterium]
MTEKIFNIEEIIEIIQKCEYCNMAMVDLDGMPYVIPMNFGYKDNFIFFHSGPNGKKINCLKNNPNICLSFSTDHKLRFQNEGVACSYSMKFNSTLLNGVAEFVENREEKIQALNIIMAHYADREFKYSEPAIKNVVIFKMKIQGGCVRRK